MDNKKILGSKRNSLLIALVFIIMVIIASVLIIIYKPNAPLPNPEENSSSLPSNYFTSKKQWSKSIPSNKSPNNNLVLGNTVSDSNIGFGKCTLYTYENNFNVDIKPNINLLFQDYINNYVHADPSITNPVCIDSDQIMARQAIHTCTTGVDCLTIFGNNMGISSSETFPINCKESIPDCDGLLASISLNFTVEDVVNIINSDTRCLSVDYIYVNKVKFEKISDFYKKSGLFLLDTGNGKDYYKTSISSNFCNPLDVRQKFRIVRYRWEKSAGSPSEYVLDDQGLFAEIFFRPGNLKLDYQDNGIVFIEKTNNYFEPNWFLIPPLDLSTNKITTNQRFQMCKDLTKKNDYYKYLTTGPSFRSKYFVDNSSDARFIQPHLGYSQGLEVIDTSYSFTHSDFIFNNYYNLPSEIKKGSKGINSIFSIYYQEKGKDNIFTKKLYNEWKNATTLKYDQPTIESISYKFTMVKPGQVNEDSTFYQSLNNNFGILGDYYFIAIGASGSNNKDHFNTNYTANVLGTRTFITDNEAIWEKKPIWENIFIFDKSYFINTNGISGGAMKEIDNITSSSTEIIYKNQKHGLLDFIDFTKATYSNNHGISNQSYYINTKDTSVGGNGLFSVNFEPDSSNLLKINSFSIIENGTNCKSIGDASFKAGDITVNNVKFICEDEDIITMALPEFSVTGGAIFENVKLNSTGTSITSLEIKEGGAGYYKDDKISIIQTDSYGTILNDTLGLTYNTILELLDPANIQKVKKLTTITVSSIDTSENKDVAHHNLAKKGTMFPLDYFNNYGFFDIKYTEYNSLKKTADLYGESPPQIAYLDSILENSAKILLKGTNDPSKLIDMFNLDKIDKGNITSVNWIKTLQYLSLNYSEKLSNELEKDIEPIVIGKFIPYSYFSTNFPEKNTLNKKYYNNNYTQFIPYGMKHVYETYIDIENLPLF